MGEFYFADLGMLLIIFLYKSFVPLLREISQLSKKTCFQLLKIKTGFSLHVLLEFWRDSL